LKVNAVTAFTVLDCTPRGEVPSAASNTFKIPAESIILTPIFWPPSALQVSIAIFAASMARSKAGPLAASTRAGVAFVALEFAGVGVASAATALIDTAIMQTLIKYCFIWIPEIKNSHLSRKCATLFLLEWWALNAWFALKPAVRVQNAAIIQKTAAFCTLRNQDELLN
jgi:hypothetical protein